VLHEVVYGHFKGFFHALADGDRRYNNNEFAPAVPLVQLEHGLDVDIGFACAVFHLDGEVIASFQLFRRGKLIATLYPVDILQYDSVVQLRHKRLIAKASIVLFLGQRYLIRAL